MGKFKPIVDTVSGAFTTDWSRVSKFGEEFEFHFNYVSLDLFEWKLVWCSLVYHCRYRSRGKTFFYRLFFDNDGKTQIEVLSHLQGTSVDRDAFP